MLPRTSARTFEPAHVTVKRRKSSRRGAGEGGRTAGGYPLVFAGRDGAAGRRGRVCPAARSAKLPSAQDKPAGPTGGTTIMAATSNPALVGQALSGSAALHASVSAAMSAAAGGNPFMAPGRVCPVVCARGPAAWRAVAAAPGTRPQRTQPRPVPPRWRTLALAALAAHRRPARPVLVPA